MSGGGISESCLTLVELAVRLSGVVWALVVDVFLEEEEDLEALRVAVEEMARVRVGVEVLDEVAGCLGLRVVVLMVEGAGTRAEVDASARLDSNDSRRAMRVFLSPTL